MWSPIRSEEIDLEEALLGQTSKQGRTAQKHRRELQEWRPERRHEELPGDDAEVDGSLCSHMNEWFPAGLQPTRGETLMAALLWRWPELDRYNRHKLPRS